MELSDKINDRIETTREAVSHNTLASGDGNEIHYKSDVAKTWLECNGLDNLRQGKDVIIKPAVLFLQEIAEKVKEVKDLYVFGFRRIKFLSPVLIENKTNGKTETIYELEKRISDPPYWSYNVKANENGRDILTCEIFLTTKDSYEFVTKDKADSYLKIGEVSPDNSNNNKIFINEALKINKEIIKPYRNAVGMSQNEYDDKYDGKFAPVLVCEKTASILFDVGNDRRKGIFAFKNQDMQLIMGNGDNENFEVKGISRHKNDASYMTNLKIIGDKGFLIDTNTFGVRVA